MTRRDDQVQQILLWEQVATRAKARADTVRADLAEAARTEYRDQGAAPSWRLPDLASVTLPLSKPTVQVADPAAWTAWVQANHPTEVETTVRPGFLPALARSLAPDGEDAVLAGTGEVVPGLRMLPGGVPGALTIRPVAGARTAINGVVDGLLESIAAALAEPTEGEP